MCAGAPHFEREVAAITMRQNLERLVATGQVLKLDGSPITYALPGQK
jgi:hypothetical protein